jgi:hypothetical protein
MERD